MTTANAIFYAVYIPLVIGIYAAWVVGSYRERRQRMESGVYYISRRTLRRIEREAKRI